MFTTEPSWDQTESLRGAAGPVDTRELCPQRSPWGPPASPFPPGRHANEAAQGEAAPSSQTERALCKAVPGAAGGPWPPSAAARGRCLPGERPTGWQAGSTCPSSSTSGLRQKEVEAAAQTGPCAPRWSQRPRGGGQPSGH